ncbi:MAG TPA: polysaccharide biosynthesis protein [Gemmatimonadales bacterium]
MVLEGKRVLITGGTGSLGQSVVRRLLTGVMGRPAKIVVFSRDEAKQHYMRQDYLKRRAVTEDVIYRDSTSLLSFRIGDMRDYSSVLQAIRDTDVVIHAAALKQVPTCEYHPYEAVQTNIGGAQNLVRAIRENDTPVEAVVAISTDKACKPINVMGMTKAIQERVIAGGNTPGGRTRFLCVRYGNVVASRGSVVPLFLDQIRTGGPVTITLKEMTRFLLSLDQAVDTVLAALTSGRAGETWIPKALSARVVDIAESLIDGRKIAINYTGIRPGEKVHEVLVSEEEIFRTVERDGYYVVRPVLPELRGAETITPVLHEEFSSAVVNLEGAALKDMLRSASAELDSSHLT